MSDNACMFIHAAQRSRETAISDEVKKHKSKDVELDQQHGDCILCQSKYRILCNISILNWVVGTWWDSRWRACWIVENLIIEPYVVIGCWLSITITNILINAQIIARNNRNLRLKPSSILDFRKPDFWPITVVFHLRTKFGAKMLIDAKIMAKNRNSRWRPSAILKFLYHHIGPPTKSFWLGTSACQILC